MRNEKKREAEGFSLRRRAVTWLARWLIVGIICAAVAHGCHPGDHGDADLLTRLIVAVGS
jgi:hypothetical protein